MTKTSAQHGKPGGMSAQWQDPPGEQIRLPTCKPFGELVPFVDDNVHFQVRIGWRQQMLVDCDHGRTKARSVMGRKLSERSGAPKANQSACGRTPGRWVSGPAPCTAWAFLLVGLIGRREKRRCSADTRAVPFAVVGRC